jgi:siroheme synthase-like protein
MGDYPIQPDLTERGVLVVGGNAAAETRVQQLLTTGAMVRVVSPTLTLRLSELVNQGIIEYRSGHFIESDLNGITLVISTLRDTTINEAVQRAANWRKVLFSRLHEIPSGRMPVLTSLLHQGWCRAH